MPSNLTPLMEQTHVIRHKGTSGDTAMAWMNRGEGYQSGIELLGHAGGTGGYETFIGINKDQRKGVVVLSSQQGGLSPETIGWLLLKGIRLSREIAIGLSAGTNAVGIGVALDFDAKTRTVRITKVIPDSPASESGLSPGLVVQRIDGVATTHKSLTECVGRIRGKPGTKIRLELFDPKQNATNLVELTRRRIQM